jgi:hypothetical protein
MLILVLISYNDWPLIKSCLEPVKDYVDHIVLVDGIFADFPMRPDDQPTSTDGTIEYFLDLETNAEKSLILYPGLLEVEKRNKYLLGDPGDWYLHLDTDEVVENPETLLELPDADVGWVQMHWTNRFARYPRLFRHVDGLHYDGLHYRLVDADGNLFTDIQQTGGQYTRAAHPLKIRHDIAMRPDFRAKQKLIYYRHLTEQEHDIKEQLRYGCYTPRPYPHSD